MGEISTSSFKQCYFHFENKINNTNSFWKKYPHPHSNNAIFILRIKSTTHIHFGRNIHILIQTIRPATTPQCYFHFENKINNTNSFREKYPHPHSHNAIFILSIKSTTHIHFERNIHILIQTIRPATTPQCYFHFENKINNTNSFWKKYPHPHSNNAIFILRIKSTTHIHFGRNIHYPHANYQTSHHLTMLFSF